MRRRRGKRADGQDRNDDRDTEKKKGGVFIHLYDAGRRKRLQSGVDPALSS